MRDEGSCGALDGDRGMMMMGLYAGERPDYSNGAWSLVACGLRSRIDLRDREYEADESSKLICQCECV